MSMFGKKYLISLNLNENPFLQKRSPAQKKRGSHGLMVLALLPDLTPTGSGEGEEGNQGPRISDCWLKLFKYK